MLRPYQDTAIDAIRGEIGSGKKRVLLVMPTGAGKTQVAAEMIRAAAKKGNSTLFVAHRRELVDQAVDRLKRDHNIEAGVIMAGRPRRDGSVMVASIQTLMRRELPANTRFLVCDEAHHAAADSWRKLLERIPGAVTVGLTATPWRLDGRGLQDMFDSIVVGATPSDLLAQGYLCKATGRAYVPPDFSGVTIRNGDYDSAGLTKAYRESKVLGDIVERWQSNCAGKRTILFAASIEISEELVARFVAAGVAAEHLDYKTPSGPRREIINRVRSGETTVVSNVGILGEGVDVPELEVAILARPTKSLSVFLQQIGRVLRPSPGKDRAWIHDHANCIVTHGFWDLDRDYSLTKSREKDAGEAPVKNCPQCFCAVAAGCLVCPECGFEFPMKQTPVDEGGEHKELTLEELRLMLAQKNDRDSLFVSFMNEAKQMGRAPGWVIYRLKDLLGAGLVFPQALWKAHVTGHKGAWAWRDPFVRAADMKPELWT